MHTHLVPPNSTPASSLVEGDMSARRLRRGGGLARSGDPGICLGEEAVVRRSRGGVRRDLLTDREHQAFDLAADSDQLRLFKHGALLATRHTL